MKPKALHGTRGRPARGKAVKKEIHPQNPVTIGHQHQNARPSVEITKCISFQKFRYSGENRPGKKYQEKDFMELRLSNLNDRVVRIVIICTDAENKELIHPNGLVGKDCHDGIYDKEYAITKGEQEIKIPYLRTERIKTKKHECDNIQTVLETRASHLPSPYKERCLSQCNDKYTSARKFDTTKVCLGVIVTIVSHQGTFNGSLHAISNVVRNASEKTTLGILKLSQPYISASDGGIIDIFTTEHGPEIEEGKYFVYVTYNDDRYGQWKSESIAVGKGEILYRRIITYKVPPFDLCPSITSSVTATLNLECPQSNQYCSCEIMYKPHTETTLPEAITNEIKRSFSSQEDLKPSPKRLKISDGTHGVEHSGNIKANLRTKLRAHQAGNYYEAAKDGDDGDYVPGEPAVISEASHVIISPRDQAMEESPAYADLVRHSTPNANGVSIIGSSNTPFLKGQGVQGNLSSSEGHPGIEVVATGYSDEVPPDTTVFIYTTTDGISGESVTAVREDQVMHMPPEEVIEYIKDPKKGGFHILTSQENTHVLSTLHNNISQIQVVDSSANESISKTVQSSGSNVRIASLASARPHFVSSSTPSSVSASDSIIRRMVVPSGKHQSSPWEVDLEEDNLAPILFPSKSNPVAQKKDYQTKTSTENQTRVVYDHSNKIQVTDSYRSSQPIQADILTSEMVGNPNETPMLDSVNISDISLNTWNVSEIAKNIENTTLPPLGSTPSSKDGV